MSLKVEHFIGHQQPSTGNILQPFFSRNLTLTFYISVEVQAISNKIFDLPLKLCSEDVFKICIPIAHFVTHDHIHILNAYVNVSLNHY